MYLGILGLVVLLSADLAQAVELANVTTNPLEPDASPKLPSEVQKAVCTVTAGEVKASAEAVTTKTLKGVCGSGARESPYPWAH